MDKTKLGITPLPHLHNQEKEVEEEEEKFDVVDCSLYVKDTGTIKDQVCEKSHKLIIYVSSHNI